MLKEGSDDGGTNIEGGLQLAYNLIQKGIQDGMFTENVNGKERTIKNISVILLTDGEPTYHIPDSKTYYRADCFDDWHDVKKEFRFETDVQQNKESTIKIIGAKEKSGNDSEVNREKAKIIANKITKELQVNGSNVALYSIAFATDDTWLKTISSNTFKAKDADKLNKVFENIMSLITLGAKAWVCDRSYGRKHYLSKFGK